MGARHVTFGDPDFFNGVHHALRVVRAVHARFPDLTFDCTVKVEHILRHAGRLGRDGRVGLPLRRVGLRVRQRRDARAARQGPHGRRRRRRPSRSCATHGIAIRPSWLPFTPWTTLDDVRAILEFVAVHDLVGNVDPVQYTIRLLLPEGSLLLGHIDGLGPWDADRLTYPWTSPLDPLQARCRHARRGRGRRADRRGLRRAARRGRPRAARAHDVTPSRPRLDEPWFCCAEPTELQLRAL